MVQRSIIFLPIHFIRTVFHLRRRHLALLLTALLLVFSLSLYLPPVFAQTTYTVVTPDDLDPGDLTCDADCTLRDAINAANTNPGPDIINFALPTGSELISLGGTALPDITEPVSIDGLSQPGSTCANPLVTINGASVTGDGLNFTAATDVSGISGLAISQFGGSGIRIASSTNLIQCNVISNNTGNGVSIDSGTGNTIRDNNISSNGGLGIDLASGANDDQPAPILTLALSNGTDTDITGSLTVPSAPLDTYTVAIYQCDGSNDEGQSLLGSVTTDGSGTTFNTTLLTALLTTNSVSATATRISTGDTSEFSACRPVTGAPIYVSNPIPGPVFMGANVGTPNATNIVVTNDGPGDLHITAIDLGADTTHFSLTSPATFTINAGAAGQNIQIECDEAGDGVGIYTTTITVTHDDLPNNPAVYDLTCDVTTAPSAQYSANFPPNATIDVGTTTQGFPTSTTLQITNAGSGVNLDVTLLSITGTNPGDFGVTSLPTGLAPGFSDPATITCTPTGTGLREATLTLDTNDPDATEDPVIYLLTCTGLAPAPIYSSTPAENGTIIVGTTPVNTAVTNVTALNIGNTGSAVLNVTDISIGGVDALDFTVNTPLPTIATGTSVDISITCTPSAAGPRTATLTVTHDAAGSPATYTLNCTGTTPTYVSTPIAGGTINVGTTPFGTPITNTTALAIDNTGNAPLNVTNFVVAGADAADFTVNTAPTTIPAGGTLNVSITCNPGAGGLRTSSLSVTHNATGSPTTYNLNCTANTPTYTSTPAASGTINVGTTPITVPITNATALVIDNTGLAPLVITSFGLATGDAAEFTVDTAPTTIAAGASLNVSITCTPTVASPRTTQLTVTHNATGSPTTYTVNCTGTAPGYSSTPAVNGTINVGTAVVNSPVTNATALVINNTGSAPLDVAFTKGGANSADFTINTADQTIAGGGSLNVSITCIPTASGLRVGTLTVTHNATGSPANYTLNCTGNAPLYISNPAINGTITVGTSQIGNPVTNAAALVITNNGTSTLTISSFTVTGGDAGEFTVNTPNNSTVLAGNSLNVSITCTPTVAAGRTTTLNVTHDDTTTTNPATYTVNCTGINTGTPIYDSTPLSGQPINIGTTLVGTPVTNASALVIRNTGTALLTADLVLSGGNATEFSLNTPANNTITSGNSLTVSITCNPTVAVLRTTTLTVNHNAAGSPATYTLNCTGTAPSAANYASSPSPGTSIDIGTSTVGTPVTNTGALLITNSGTAPLNVSFGVTGTNAAEFVVNTPGGAVAANNGTLNVTITCTPTATGLRSATLNVTHDATNIASPATYPLTCTGTTPGAPGYGSTPAPNGTITISTTPGTPASTTLTISETGGSPLTINSYTLSGSAAALTAITVTGPTFPFTIPDAGPSQTLTLSCNSATAVSLSATLTVQHTAAGSPATYTVNCVVGSGAPADYDSDPAPGSTINVGTVQIGTAISVNLRVFNRAAAGSQNLSVTLPAGNLLIFGPNAADFAVITNPPPFTVNPQGSIDMTIRCIPTITGLEVATLTFRTNDPGQPTVSYQLNCIGSGTPVSTSTPIGFIATATPFVPTPTPIVPATGTVSNEVKGLAMRTGPYLGATLAGAIRPGKPFSILAQSNDESPQFIWYLVADENGVTGWVSGRFFNVTGNLPAVPFQGSVFDTIDNAPDTGVTARAMAIIDIRRRPSGRASILGQIPQGATVSIMGRTRQNGGDFWVQIRYNGIIGWIPAAPISVNGSTNNVPIR